MSPSRTTSDGVVPLKRPSLPSRDESSIVDKAPADALKPDEDAIDDVHMQVEQTGSLEAAARKLAQLAKDEHAEGSSPALMQRRQMQQQAWWDDPEEAEYFAQVARQQADVEEEDEYDEDDEIEVEHMNEVVEGLWIGDLVSAMDTEGLRKNNITNVVSLLRPRLQFDSDIACYAVEVDDAPETDLLTHLPSTTAWIQQCLQKRAGFPVDDERVGDIDPKAPPTNAGGVLVHCQAGMSRSATVVAAFLMTDARLDPVEAITILREKRPTVDPSETFWHQLGLYYLADGKVTLKDRSTRQWYLERTTGFVMNEGGRPTTEHMAKYPATPTPSQPATPAGGHGRRKIRCKMCRQHLALREHMMDHILDQAPVSRPRTPSNFSLPGPVTLSALTPATNPKADEAIDDEEEQSPERPRLDRRPSISSEVINPLTGLPPSRSRRASLASGAASGAATPDIAPLTSSNSVPSARRSRSGSSRSISSARSFLSGGIGPEKLSMTRADPDKSPDRTPDREASEPKLAPKDDDVVSPRTGPGGRPILDADQLAARLPPQLAALRTGSGSTATTPPGDDTDASANPSTTASATGSTAPSANASPSKRRTSSNNHFSGVQPMAPMVPASGPPILVNPKCSGYFVEPLTWMEPVLEAGNVAGKLVCPNPKCGAKIGNYDWAGVQCGCREWVTPGFCISRSKVDEVW